MDDYESIQELVESGDLSGAADLAAVLEQEYADSNISDEGLSTEEYDAEFGTTDEEFEEREGELGEYWNDGDIDIDYGEYDTGDQDYA